MGAAIHRHVPDWGPSVSTVLSPPHPAERVSPCARPHPIERFRATTAPVKVIYIAGYGRSGTTLLDIALGEHPAIMGGGEIATLARHVWANGEYCACGASVRACLLWRGIVEDWQGGEPAVLMDEYRAAQERTETIAGIGRAIERRASSRHEARTVRLFRSIAARSDRPVVVDSSKLPGRGFALAGMAGIDLYVVHVVRDGRGVAWSLKKGYARAVDKGLQRELRPKPLVHSALRWSIVNVAAEMLCRRVGRAKSLRVRYEDFVHDPQATLARIVRLVGKQPATKVAGALAPQHQVAGSRHRMQPRIVLSRDEGWKAAMPRLQQWFVTVLTAPLLWRYGYPLRAETGRDRPA